MRRGNVDGRCMSGGGSGGSIDSGSFMVGGGSGSGGRGVADGRNQSSDVGVQGVGGGGVDGRNMIDDEQVHRHDEADQSIQIEYGRHSKLIGVSIEQMWRARQAFDARFLCELSREHVQGDSATRQIVIQVGLDAEKRGRRGR